jgi:16S rRNA processing protein RimM
VLTRTRGHRGELVAIPLSSQAERFYDLRRVFLFGDGTPAEVESVWNHQGRWVFKFRGIDTLSDAERLTGTEIRVPAAERAQLSPGEYYHSDLIGCEVVERDGRSIGRVVDFQEAGGSGLLELESGLLIPFAKSICVEINPGERRIVVNLPEGLRELNQP